MINVQFFALFRELLNCDQLELNSEDLHTVADVSAQLTNHFAEWSSLSQKYQVLIAVNQTMADETTKVNAGDEIAFFPPVTGG